MTTNNFITDTPLPASQSFSLLKNKALEFIKEHIGSEWTNFNPSDPGITILDQICYAITELGYCSDFPIEDILTGRDGKFKVDEQFYLPEIIFTSSPVTVEDYRKYIVDKIEEIDNAIILPMNNSYLNLYRVYLLLHHPVTNDPSIIINRAFFSLNASRNLGELFLKPEILLPKPYIVEGSIELDNLTNPGTFLNTLNQLVENFIFPVIPVAGYDTLKKDGYSTDIIFNGPQLKNGWSPATLDDRKRNKFELSDLVNILESQPGVFRYSITGLYPFYSQQPTNVARSKTGEIIRIIFQLTINNKIPDNQGRPLPSSYTLLKSGTDPEALNGKNIKPALPGSTYRDINNYYSIQNTFPEIFGVGPDVISPDMTSSKLPESKQLKGYLTLFDQVLANQFSQLANVDRLFSFKNAVTGAPSDTESFYAIKDDFEKNQELYPAPYKTFSPTYFYQSLYEVPLIRPLLKNNESFKFDSVLEPLAVLEEQSWVSYKQNPYNAYMRGLQEIIEVENTNLVRRNKILDHLLARHGESPLIINAFIDGSAYSGNSLKDKVIIKSLYLQNLDRLSYFRMKGYNFAGADDVSTIFPNEIKDFFSENRRSQTNDFIINSERINQAEKLCSQDFVNYSALELKLCLLFGLRRLYLDFIAPVDESVQDLQEVEQALWLIVKLRGLLMIESGLLHYCIQDPAFIGLNDILLPPVNDNYLFLIFPSFIPQLNNDSFKNRLGIFLENSLPVTQKYKLRFIDSNSLAKLISAFNKWHNDLRYQNEDINHPDGYWPAQDLKESASLLSDLLAIDD